MKVFVFGTRGFPDIQGGVEKHCEMLYPKMSTSFDITVFRRKAFLSSKATISYKNIRFIDLPSTRIKGVEPLLHSFLSACVCMIKRPDLVHIHNIGPGLFTPLVRLAGIPVILTYHSPNYEHKKWGTWGRRILRIGEKLSLKFSNRIIFVNKFQQSKYPDTIQSKSVFIANGIEPPSITTQNDYIHSLGLTEKKYILTVGRITQEKGFDYLIDAFLAMDNKNDFKLVIAGGADHKQEYVMNVRKKAENKNIVMTGYVTGNPLHQLYSHAGLFVLPSYNEGFPIALLEAMSYQLPVIASDIPGNKQVTLPADHYFKTGDVESLRIKLEEKSHNSHTISYDLAPYDWEKIAVSVASLYTSLTKPQSPPLDESPKPV